MAITISIYFTIAVRAHSRQHPRPDGSIQHPPDGPSRVSLHMSSLIRALLVSPASMLKAYRRRNFRRAVVEFFS